MTEVPEAVRRAFADARSILFVTGAGISADSGLPVYRGIGGLYDKPTDEGLPIEEVLSGEMLRDDPALCWKYMGEIERASRGAQPNAAHRAIASLEARARVAVLTQNVDGLHLDAGSTDVIEIHGTLRRLVCPACGRTEQPVRWEGREIPPRCACGAFARPAVVLFGEALPHDAVRRLEAALRVAWDLVVSVGTTSQFPYVAAPVLRQVERGRPAIEINPGETAISAMVPIRWAERAAIALSAVLDSG